MRDQASKNKGADGKLAMAMRRALPALLALAPAAGLAGGGSVSSGVRQTGRRVEPQTSANVYRLEAAPVAAVDAFSAFAAAPGEPVHVAEPAEDVRSDAALRRFLTESGLLAPTSKRASSQIMAHKHSQQAITASIDAMDDGPAVQESLVDDSFRRLTNALGSSRISGRSGAIETGLGSFSEGSFAGRPQLSGTCRTTSYCSSDGGIYCFAFGGDGPCTGPRPPGVFSIVLEGAPTSTATSVNFIVSFDEWMFNTDLTGGNSVTTDDFVLTTTGSASGTVSGVTKIAGTSASGEPNSSYRITVNALAGNGTIRLDVRPNTNIVDANPRTIFGQPHGAGGPFGNGNAGFTPAFTTGSVHTVALNSAPTGSVTINGTATEDQTLTANTSTLADANGLGPFNYQWRRGGVPIVGATASTYVLGDADVGALISVTVSYTDGLGNPESVTSASVGPVANINDLPTGAVTISGTATENQTLTASNTLADADGLGPISYQWRRGGVPIVGGTASTYLLGDADVGALITVTASYTDGRGTNEAVTSAAVGPVANINDLPTGTVTISGTATEDQTLTAVSTLADGDGIGTLNYQWRRNGGDVTGATNSTYLLGDADVGATISVVVNYIDLQGTAEGPFTGGPTAPVANVNDAPTGAVTISGTATEDQTLTASNTLADADGLGPISYQWRRGGVPIVGATTNTYLLGDADVGALITVTASYTDGQGTPEAVTSASVGPVANINDLPTGTVTIGGTATENQTLTASNTLADADGLGPISYQWRRGGVPIVGATASTYLLGDADVGALITVTASYTDGRGTNEAVTSSVVGPVANINDVPTGGIAISGTATEDQTLTAVSTLADGDGLGTLNYQWRRNGGDITGATNSTYLLGDADVGATISVVVNYIDQQGTAEGPFLGGPTAPVANVNDPPTGGASIAGIPQRTQTLSANTSTLADDDGLGALSYQWRADAVPIAGATASTYVLVVGDVGKLISVGVSYVDGHSTSESVTSAAIGPVLNFNNPPTGGVTVAGSAIENQTLTASDTLADPDGLGAFNYQWNRNAVPIAGATASTLVLGNADVGAAISVTVSYTDGASNPESITSAATGPVVNVNDPPTGGVAIAGIATENQTLTASNTLADADGLGPIGYQWNRGGVAIAGATASTYVLGNADVGALITVTASYTDLHGTPESATSAPTAAVVNVNDVPTGGVSIAGTVQEDQTLSAVSTLADGDGLGPLNYQWRRNGVDVAGATGSSFLLGDADVNNTISVSVGYTDLHGTTEGPFLGGPTAPVLNVNDPPGGTVTIQGTAQAGQTLAAQNTLTDADGLGPFSYQWNRNGVAIVGATAASYLVGDADVGAAITVTVSYTDGNGTPESVTSAPLGPVMMLRPVPGPGVLGLGLLALLAGWAGWWRIRRAD